MVNTSKSKPFKFSNFLAFKPQFKEVVTSTWSNDIMGFNMFKVVNKLKMLKTLFRKLLYVHGNLHRSVNNLRKELDEVQIAIDHDPLNFTLREEEVVYPNAFKDAVLDEERFLKKKEKVEWLKSLKEVRSQMLFKILTNRNKEGLADVVSINQSAFMPDRRISDNILLTQELMLHYHQDLRPPRCTMDWNIKNDLRKLKGKDIVDNAAQVSDATIITPGMYKLDPVTLAPNDKNNRETHIYYLKHTMEQAAILREIVEQAISLNPLNTASYSACKYVKLIQELLGYVRDTCPDIHKPSEKLVMVTPINKKKIVRFAEPVISSRVSRSTKSSRSKSIDNTKNDRILQISSSIQKKNKVENYSRIVKSCLNKPNYDVEPSRNANVQHSKLNTNSELMCIKCDNSMFDARHELCFLEFVFDMNARRTFTLVGNACPLTRIAATNKVPLREPIPLEVVAQESIVTNVYTRRPKVPKTNGSNSKPKIKESMISNKKEPDTSRGSNTSVAPSSSLVDLRLSKLFCGIRTPDAQSI
ncbi:hypothetical protein Tco_1015753 [Tanacetum coccineum]|uniref:Uncharacterized protein n=1 Tax=Tanacetum coccineum TaxID=301880 RepID=A0ABQ5FLP8_9ASTR